MKNIAAIPWALIFILPCMAAENASNLTVKKSPTREQLNLARRKAAQENPMHKLLKPTQGPDPSIVNQPKDLISESDIICFNGAATLIPKRAILSLPKNFADRLKFQLGSKILSWSEFYAQNRGWITTIEVSRVQAEGNKPLAEATTTSIGKSANLVVATYMNGPISVLPLKTPKEEIQEITEDTSKVTPKK